MKFLKTFDIYEPNINFNNYKSSKRGGFVAIISLVFIINYILTIYNNIHNPKLESIFDLQYFETTHFNFNSTKFLLNISLSFVPLNEKGNLIKTNCNPILCFSEVNYHNNTCENLYKNLFRYNLNRTYNLSSPVFGLTLKIDESCEKIVNQWNVGLSYEETAFSSVYNDIKKLVTTKKVKTYSSIKREEKSTTLFRGFINILINDYKRIFDFGKLSTILENNLKSNYSFLNYDDAVYTPNEIVLERFDKNKVFNNYVEKANFFFEFKPYCRLYVNTFMNPLNELPMFFSIMTLFVRLSQLLAKVIYFKYKFFSFLNEDCCLIRSYSDSNINLVRNTLQNIITNVELLDNNKYLKNNYVKEISSKNSVNNVENNQYVVSLNLNESNNDSINFNSYLQIENSLNSSFVQNILKKANEANLSLKKVKYSKLDALLMVLPFSICRSKQINSKLKLLKHVQSHIQKDYRKTTSNNNLYKFITNFKHYYGEHIIQRPLFYF